MPTTQVSSESHPAPPRPLSGADSFWLRMDHPTNLMMINGLMRFDEPLDYERLEAIARDRLLPLPRFRERVVVAPSGRARWERAPQTDLDYHLVRERLPGTGDEAALRDLVSEKMSQPLDFARPLWRFHVVDNYRGGAALIGRFHHCMGDGIGLMMVLLGMTDLEAGTADSAGELASQNPFLELVRGDDVEIVAVRRKLEELMPEGMRLLLKPGEIFRSLGFWRRGAASAVALARLTFRSADSKTLLNAQLGVPKRAAWSEAIPLEEIRRIKDGLGGTVNDLLLTALAGGMRRYLIERDGDAGCKDFRATVPVSLRPIERLATLGNEFGLVYLKLPVHIADPAARLAELRRRMEKLKRSAESLVSLRVLGLMGRLPAAAQRGLVRMFASKATAVMTNVPGPTKTLYVAGKPIRDLLFWVPRSARLSLGVSIMTYAGNVGLGIATDAGLVPDPERIVEGYHEELAAMRALASAPR